MEQQPQLLLPDRYTNIAPEDCIEMLMPTIDEDHLLSAALSGGACLHDVPMYAPSPSLAAVPESFAFPAPAPAPAPPSVVAGWAEGVARAAAATAAALRAAAARAAAPDEPMAAAGALPARRGLPRAAPSQCQAPRGGGSLLRAAATASASGSSSASDGSASPARWPRPPLAPTPKQQSMVQMTTVHEGPAPRRSPSADDIASMVAAIDTGAVGKGARKRGRAATPRATASCVVLSSSASLSSSQSASASASESPPEARRADVEAMLGDAVANGFRPQAGPPAEQAQDGQQHGRARPEPPQQNASVAWLRAALGLGPA